MTGPNLPEYDSPPAIETLMGFHFVPIGGLTLLKLGEISAVFREQYPVGSLLPPVGELSSPAAFSDLNAVAARAMFANHSGTELVQVQSSAFLRNWRQTPENKAYSHYSDLKPKFRSDWLRFVEYVAGEGFPPPVVLQCEVTYVNHLVRGREWDSYSDLARLVKLFAPRQQVADFGRTYNFLPEAANVGLHVGYSLPKKDLTLQFVAQSAVTMPEGTEVLQLTITAKAASKKRLIDEQLEALDDCHEAVILGFDDVTTDFAHQLWGKR